MLIADHQNEGAGARNARPLQQELHATDSALEAALAKRQATLAAKLALAGYSMSAGAEGTYLVSRLNLTAWLADLDAVDAFLRKVAP